MLMFLMVVLISACSKEPQQNEQEVFKHDALGLSITKPAGWYTFTEEDMKSAADMSGGIVDVLYMASKEKDVKGDVFNSNIIVNVEEISGFSVEEYIDATVEMMNLFGMPVKESRIEKVNGKDFGFLELEQDGFDQKIYIRMVDDSAVLITLSYIDQDKDEIQTVIDSIQVK
jgi:hypothetical protein